MTHHVRMSAEDEPYLLKTPEAAELLRVSPKTLYLRIARGEFEGACKKQGKHYIFHREKLIELVDHSFKKKAQRK